MKKLILLLALAALAVSIAAAQENDTGEAPETEEIEAEEIEATEAEEAELEEAELESEAEDTEEDERLAESEERDNEREISSMRYPFGAQIRMLQLKYAVLAGILGGEQVVAHIEAKQPNASVDKLNEILDKMQLIVEDIDAVDYNKPAEELAKEFVDLKNESRMLAKEFRDEARKMLAPGDRQELARMIKDMPKDELKAVHDEMRSAMREFNAQRFQAAMQRMGIDRQDIADRIRQGEMPAQQIAQQVRERFQTLSNEEKRQALNRIKEEATKAQVYKTAAIAQIMSNVRERQSERLQQRSEDAARLAERFQERNMTRVSEALRQRSENLADIGGIAADRSERLEQISQNMRDRLPPRPPRPGEAPSEEGSE